MAKKGTTIWELSHEERVDPSIEDATMPSYIRVVGYALRSDGVILRSLKTKELDGSARYNYGWTVHTRKPRGNEKEILLSKGFSKV